MKYIIVLSILLFSCQSFKQWQRKGITNKWLDTTTIKRDSSKALEKDSSSLKAIADSTNKDLSNIVDSTYQANKDKPCPEVIDTVREQIIKYINRTLKPKLLDLPVYKDDSLQVDNEHLSLKILYKDGKLSYKVSYKQCIINTPSFWYEKYWWIWLIVGFISGGALFYFASIKVK